jgi:hypothetical protein
MEPNINLIKEYVFNTEESLKNIKKELRENIIAINDNHEYKTSSSHINQLLKFITNSKLSLVDYIIQNSDFIDIQT